MSNPTFLITLAMLFGAVCLAGMIFEDHLLREALSICRRLLNENKALRRRIAELEAEE